MYVYPRPGRNAGRYRLTKKESSCARPRGSRKEKPTRTILIGIITQATTEEMKVILAGAQSKRQDVRCMPKSERVYETTKRKVRTVIEEINQMWRWRGERHRQNKHGEAYAVQYKRVEGERVDGRQNDHGRVDAAFKSNGMACRANRREGIGPKQLEKKAMQVTNIDEDMIKWMRDV